MKFAIVGESKAEAAPKLKGICQSCGGEMVAKCGRILAWHWSHKTRLNCDPWWENETAWHRQWKNEFPEEWQEVLAFDPVTGEEHIADVKTSHGLVIEFQNSPILPAELASREDFYTNMIWIVNGQRNEPDADNFNIGLQGELQSDPIAYKIRWPSRSRLLHNWSAAKSKVFLDFGDKVLWQLIFFNAAKSAGAVGPLFRDTIIEDCIQGTTPFRLLCRPQPD